MWYWYPADRVFVHLDGSFHDGTASAYVMDEMNSSSDGHDTHFHLKLNLDTGSYSIIGSPMYFSTWCLNLFQSMLLFGSELLQVWLEPQYRGTRYQVPCYHQLGMICIHGTSPLSCRFLNLEADTVVVPPQTKLLIFKQTMARACPGDDTYGHPICMVSSVALFTYKLKRPSRIYSCMYC